MTEPWSPVGTCCQPQLLLTQFMCSPSPLTFAFETCCENSLSSFAELWRLCLRIPQECILLRLQWDMFDSVFLSKCRMFYFSHLYNIYVFFCLKNHFPLLHKTPYKSVSIFKIKSVLNYKYFSCRGNAVKRRQH